MNLTVSTIIYEKHGIAAHPGAKVECPFCHHQTFSIKKGDTLGKCFHPSCGRYIAPYQSEFGRGNILYKILDEIFEDMHKALLELDRADYPNAYGYCVKERGIHPRVLADSMLGAIPSRYDLSSRFSPYIEEAEAAVKAETEKKKGKSRPRTTKGYTPQDQLDFLLEAREKLSNCVQHHAGWLAFFYTDAKHRIVSIRFREPFAKRIVYFKPTKMAGVFNHGLFTPYTSPRMKHINDLLIVTEGEFNQLQLQSLCARKAEKDGSPPERGYVFACAVGGVNNADAKTIRCLTRTPVVCYDNDVSEAGFALVESILEKASVTAFTTPVPDSDLDDFIREFE